uniref:Cytochrome c oxidase subunit 1 n=1 Tax=Schistosoma japonicum TaxID=6182 RepID=Q5BTD4_SCHJA|nr:SJCHGC01982 protein [Schistosoma japonicum]
MMVPSIFYMELSLYYGSGVGWTFYPPLSSLATSGVGVDYLMVSLHLAGGSRLIGSINFITTIMVRLRACSSVIR